LEETGHLSYERKFNEDLEDIAGLCIPCHRYMDGFSDEDHAATLRADAYPMRADVGPLEFGVLVGRQLGSPAEESDIISIHLECHGESLVIKTYESKCAAIEKVARVYRGSVSPGWDSGIHIPSGALRSELFMRNRPMWPATCPDCGVEHEVPFEPKFSRYVRCQEHYESAVNG